MSRDEYLCTLIDIALPRASVTEQLRWRRIKKIKLEPCFKDTEWGMLDVHYRPDFTVLIRERSSVVLRAITLGHELAHTIEMCGISPIGNGPPASWKCLLFTRIGFEDGESRKKLNGEEYSKMWRLYFEEEENLCDRFAELWLEYRNNWRETLALLRELYSEQMVTLY